MKNRFDYNFRVSFLSESETICDCIKCVSGCVFSRPVFECDWVCVGVRYSFGFGFFVFSSSNFSCKSWSELCLFVLSFIVCDILKGCTTRKFSRVRLDFFNEHQFDSSKLTLSVITDFNFRVFFYFACNFILQTPQTLTSHSR